MPGMAETAVATSVGTRPWVPPVAVAGAAVAGCVYLAWQDPSQPGSALPQCPTKLLTGLDCPLCGGLRCVRAVTTGNLGAAASDNLVLLLALPVLVLLWVRWLLAAAGAPVPPLRVGRRTTYALVGLAVGWTVVRNLPAWPLHPLT
jgi:hypothetical protein